MKFKPQFKRLVFIDRKIREGRYPNCFNLAADWEVSDRTIRRDLDFLRDELEAPLAFDAKRNGFYYTATNWFLPSVLTSHRDLLALLIGIKALAAYSGVSEADRLRSAFGRWGGPVTEDVNPEDVLACFTFTVPPARRIEPEIWDGVVRALVHRQAADIVYRPVHGGEERTQRIYPWHAANLQGEWYLFARVPATGETVQFALARIKRLKVLDEIFTRPKSFHPDRLLGRTFGRYVHGASDKTREVVLLFDADLYAYISEKTWHPKQRVRRRRDGRVELVFPVAAANDVFYWVLGFGAAVEVVRPAALRKAIHDDLRRASARYARL